MTDKPKWTPGDWRVDADGDVIAPDGPVAGPFYPDNFDTWPTWEQRKADAHLIAAAPDMATVLEYYADQFCEGFCKDLPQAGTYQPEMDLDCSGCKARAALAKARGQS